MVVRVPSMSTTRSSRKGKNGESFRSQGGGLDGDNDEGGGWVGDFGMDGQEGDVTMLPGDGMEEEGEEGEGMGQTDVIPPPSTRPATGDSSHGRGLIQSDLVRRIQTTSAGSKHRAKHAYLLDIAMGEGSDDENNNQEGGKMGSVASLSICASDMAHIPKLGDYCITE